MNAPAIHVPALHPRNTTGRHCRRFYSAIAWDDAEQLAMDRTMLRRHVPSHRGVSR